MIGSDSMYKKTTLLKLTVVVSYIIMLVFNILSFIFPFNGVLTTPEIAKSYPNLLMPSDFTFSIWTFLYLLLALLVVYQLNLIHLKQDKPVYGFTGHEQRKLNPEMYNRISIYFIISCLLNAGWILAWNFDYIALSLLIMITLLILLAVFNKLLGMEDLSISEGLLVRLPFSVYYGWVSVLIVSNLIALLTSIRFNWLGISKPVWAVILLLFILAGVSFRARKNKDIAYCLTILWALAGILVKHTSGQELDGRYPVIIAVITGCIVIISGEILYLVYEKNVRK
jgi:hypothetical protein